MGDRTRQDRIRVLVQLPLTSVIQLLQQGVVMRGQTLAPNGRVGPISTFVLYLVCEKKNQHLINGTDFGNHVLHSLGVVYQARLCVGRALLRPAGKQVSRYILSCSRLDKHWFSPSPAQWGHLRV